MQPPRFWYGAEGRDSALLLQALAQPLSWLYAAISAAKIAHATPERVAAPVICVGNLTVGGAGKTPVVRAIRAQLRAMGVEAHTLSRGHGGALKGPVRVNDTHTAADVGDEPLLHARDGAAWIARDRLAGALAMIAAGAQAIVMDDGFQNPALAKHLSVLVFDAEAGAGNARVVPAGPLREPLKAGLARANAVILIHGSRAPARSEDDDPSRLDRALEGFGKPILHATLEPQGEAPAGPLLAFAGIGRPQKFFDTLKALGGDMVDGASFPDHHAYAEADLKNLAAHASAHGARLITTEKDHVRLPPAWRAQVLTLPVVARFAEPETLDALLRAAVAKRREAP
ncbi:MAG: tetraacyldisaccharide 4'-kinase [Hyphomonadaceae bacterium]|nr:MAG: tetraacyldisaccharide 4'-kinase [Caulobacteraceae bacterium]MBT9445972.1 tetraacyldisaccharide 4'-kinase [Hyphomonadaceae bacterium]TPW04632.1 MAG: tetraacyldisaccharide 4'-kinase [Alphaproteobacteria bacterium]